MHFLKAIHLFKLANNSTDCMLQDSLILETGNEGPD